MKFFKAISVCLIISIILLIFTGCWNYREISDLSIVGGVAIDKNEENNNYILTVEIASPSQSVGEKGGILPKVLRSEGITLFDAIRNMITLSGKRLYWSHTQIAIISNQIAAESLIPELDWLNRDGETRSDINLLISKEKTAGEIFDGEPTTEDMISFFLGNALRTQNSVTRFPVTNIFKYISEYRSKSIAPVIPTVSFRVVDTKKIPRIEGCAIMKNDKLVGYLNGEETKYMLFIKNEVNGGIIPEIVPRDNNKSRVALEINNNKTKIKPVFSNNNLKIDINIKTDASVGELESTINYLEAPVLESLINLSEAKLTSHIKNIFEIAQKQLDADIFGIGQSIQINMPKYWKTIEKNWDEEFKNMKIDINTTINLRNSATISKTLEIGDKK
jgi:spore germination protein KC